MRTNQSWPKNGKGKLQKKKNYQLKLKAKRKNREQIMNESKEYQIGVSVGLLSLAIFMSKWKSQRLSYKDQLDRIQEFYTDMLESLPNEQVEIAKQCLVDTMDELVQKYRIST
jgi:hypothetical protein